MVLWVVPDALDRRNSLSSSFVKFCELFCEQFEAKLMERVKGFEPSTSCLGSKHSAAELHPQRRIHSSLKIYECKEGVAAQQSFYLT